MEHPDVADCAVIPVPDQYSGEVPLAFVTLNKAALDRVIADKEEAERIKASITKVVSILRLKKQYSQYS